MARPLPNSAVRPPTPLTPPILSPTVNKSPGVDGLVSPMANMNIQQVPKHPSAPPKSGRSRRVYAPAAGASLPLSPNTLATSTVPSTTGSPAVPPPSFPSQAATPAPSAVRPPCPKAKIDPNQIPSPVAAQMRDQETYETQPFGTCSQDSLPLPTTDFRAIDQGNCNPRFMRATISAIPRLEKLLEDTSLPFGVVVNPLAALHVDDQKVSVAEAGSEGPPRCRRCRGYVNPWCTFTDSGRKYKCNLCDFVNEVPDDYFSHLDMSGRRMDIDQRPELQLGSVEFNVPSEYWDRTPAPLHIVFAVDVSASSVRSGLLSVFCSTLKAILYSGQFPANIKIALMTFDDTVHFYNLSPSLDQASMMVVSDIDDVFIPLAEGCFAEPQASKSVIEGLLDTLPSMFANTAIPVAVLGASAKASLLALAQTGGKLCIFQTLLPSKGPGALKNRDDPKLYGTDKENTLFKPQDIFYTNLAKECVKQGVCVDLWLFPQNTYVDISTLGQLTGITGGDVHYYPNFDKDKEGLQFAHNLQHTLLREQGYNSALKIRCSNGLTIAQRFGNCLPSGSKEIEVAGIDSDKSFAFELLHDDKLTSRSEVFLQCALLYTTVCGQRRVRVHNLSLPIEDTVSGLFRKADLDVSMNFICRQTIADLPKRALAEIASDLDNRCVKILSAYRKHCVSKANPSQLILPESFKILPLYVLGFKKSLVLRKDFNINSDLRAYNIRKMNAVDVPLTIQWLYPRMIKLHEWFQQEGSNLLPLERISYERLDSRGMYLVGMPTYFFLHQNESTAYLWIGQHVSEDILQGVFGVSQLDQVNPSTALDDERPFTKELVEDEHFGLMSYVDYLCLVHKRIQSEV
ncbi:Sec23/Sec24 trunk domain-containing protein [Radiomyces spectabilis]|uniref:Sec23/Sec24 trunk domain-containing protein n=1 Tax=Radiomyces spectabilis TaxID=64574 RepID=UPI002220F5DC|nr:Sec23/Sec24 trunk domain-containing protein [Radiomyces spectabilis]KAI8368227.1 Sec23/Sec24 trunk domain-containing protein [Radiomyces spectabilis]